MEEADPIMWGRCTTEASTRDGTTAACELCVVLW